MHGVKTCLSVLAGLHSPRHQFVHIYQLLCSRSGTGEQGREGKAVPDFMGLTFQWEWQTMTNKCLKCQVAISGMKQDKKIARDEKGYLGTGIREGPSLRETWFKGKVSHTDT